MPFFLKESKSPERRNSIFPLAQVNWKSKEGSKSWTEAEVTKTCLSQGVFYLSREISCQKWSGMKNLDPKV
jgi:hypothetical protein